MNRMLLLASATALFATAIPAAAQEASGTDQTAGAQRGGNDITCREISTMDTATVPGVLYFISGYTAGRDDAMAAGSGGTASNATGSGSGDMTSGATAQTGSDATGSASSGSTASSADASATEGAAGETTASTSTTQSSDTSGSTTTADAGSTTGQAASDGTTANPQVGMIRGYFNVPVERVMVACQNAPDSRASDVIRQESGSGASGASAN